MKATIGRIVIALGGAAISNGTNVAPAIITRVWADNAEEHGRDTRSASDDKPVLINVTAFPDLKTEQHLSSIRLFDTKEQAEKGYEPGGPAVAYWPPRE